jgi:hypothetical protein
MNNIEKLNLIEGRFSDEEAKEILMNIFSTKINFHNIKNLSSQVRYGTDDETANKRISELNKEIEKLSLIISKAKSENKKLEITSEIRVSLSDF